MARLELRTTAYSSSIAPTALNMDGNSTLMEAFSNSNSDSESFVTIRQTGSAGPDVSDAIDGAQRTFEVAFDHELKNSRPHTKAMRDSLTWSLRSSVVGTVGWSCLSGLSLADVSEVSVVNLPVSARELWNGQRYCSLYSGSHGVLKGIAEHKARTGSRSRHNSQGSHQGSESLLEATSRLGSISPTSNHDSIKSRSASLQTVKRSWKPKHESLVPEGRRTPSISIGQSGIPTTILPRKILLLGMVEVF